MATTPVKENPDTEFLQHYLKNNITAQPNGTYSLQFPWKTNHPYLQSNYTVSAKHTKFMANHLANTPQLLQLYNRIIEDQESRGFIERVSRDKSTSFHYILHHPVRKESLTTSICIVYDCSCKQSPDFNDCLNPGPPFLNDLCAIFLRFRQHNIAFSSDIEKAFLHIHLTGILLAFSGFPTQPIPIVHL